VEITVVMEEGVVLRRGSLVLAPSDEKSTVVLVPPFGTKFSPTVWRPPRGRIHDHMVSKKQPTLRGRRAPVHNLWHKLSFLLLIYFISKGRFDPKEKSIQTWRPVTILREPKATYPLII
jgi:hypothetical protein